MARHLRQAGYVVRRERARRLMKRGYGRFINSRRTTIPHPDHKIWPYLLRGLVIDWPN